jgi:KDO2-lipid IV(A) lauroyltransferase
VVRIHSIRDGLRVLKQKGMVAIVGDQDGDKFGVFAPFFGASASTHVIGELLARRSGSAMTFGVPVRLGPRQNHVKVHMIPPAPAGLSEVQGTAYVLAEYNRLLEDAIRQHPEQWLWMHERWRSLPFHRLSGEPRRRAEAGEIVFDMVAQTWRDKASGEAIQVPGWK